MYDQFQKTGRDLFLSGIISSHGGNLSVRVGDRILITRRGSMLAHLEERDIIETGLHKNDSGIALASSEVGVHRAIYQQTSALAIVHAHPPYSVVLSLTRDEIVPVDSEGSYLLHKVPVVAAEQTVGSAEVARIIPPVLKQYKIAMLRGHGSFAAGQFLEEAYQWTSSLECSSQMVYLLENGKGERKEYRHGSDAYTKW
ncbi:MAG: aldolase [Bacillota bacterium]